MVRIPGEEATSREQGDRPHAGARHVTKKNCFTESSCYPVCDSLRLHAVPTRSPARCLRFARGNRLLCEARSSSSRSSRKSLRPLCETVTQAMTRVPPAQAADPGDVKTSPVLRLTSAEVPAVCSPCRPPVGGANPHRAWKHRMACAVFRSAGPVVGASCRSTTGMQILHQHLAREPEGEKVPPAHLTFDTILYYFSRKKLCT